MPKSFSHELSHEFIMLVKQRSKFLKQAFQFALFSFQSFLAEFPDAAFQSL
jgi:hypothetical protein